MARNMGGRRPLGEVIREIEGRQKANRIVGGPGVLISTSGAGQTVDADGGESDGLWIELLTVGVGVQAGFYGWRRTAPSGLSTWTVVAGEAGTLASNPAWNVSASPNFAVGTHVRAWYDPGTGHPRFQGEACPP